MYCRAGVDELVARVRQLGTVAPATAAAVAVSEAEQPSPPAAAAAAAGAAGSQAAPVVEAAPLLPSADMAIQPVSEPMMEAHSPAEEPSGSSLDSGLTPGELQLSPTERLLGCRQRLLQRPLTAPGLVCGSPAPEAALQRPATVSPGKVKSLMQVGGWSAADTFVAGHQQVC